MAAPLSDYEQLRQENIRKNQEFLNGLGLRDKKNAKSNAPSSSSSTLSSSGKSQRRKRGAGDVESDSLILHDTGTRKSARIRGIQLETPNEDVHANVVVSKKGGIALDEKRHDAALNEVFIDDEGISRHKISAAALREYIEKNSSLHADSISDKDIIHTVYRVQSMSNKALGNRIRAISSSSSATSKIKMLTFFYALSLSNLEELAQSAYNILTHTYRVKGMEGDFVGSDHKLAATEDEVELVPHPVKNQKGNECKLSPNLSALISSLPDDIIRETIHGSSAEDSVIGADDAASPTNPSDKIIVTTATRPQVTSLVWKFIKLHNIKCKDSCQTILQPQKENTAGTSCSGKAENNANKYIQLFRRVFCKNTDGGPTFDFK